MRPLLLAAVSAAAGAAVAAAVLRSRPRSRSAARGGSAGAAAAAAEPPESVRRELLAEQLSRNRTFFGAEGAAALEGAFVIVVGLGGVGSHAAHMLARAGVGRLRLIDFDQVTLSSLNRHAVATRADVGTPKVEAMAARLRAVVPDCAVEPVAEMFTGEAAERLLGGAPALVLDCIDDATTKTALLAFCVRRELPVVTAMAAGGKADPTRLRIGAMTDCLADPLAHKIRALLRKQGVKGARLKGIPTVYSSEPPRVGLLPLDAQQAANPDEFGAVDNFRVRVMPVLGTTPAVFGQAMAAWALARLGGMPLEPLEMDRLTRDARNKMLHRLRQRCQNSPEEEEVWLDVVDVDWAVRVLWSGVSAVSQQRVTQGRFEVAKWRADRPLAPDNIVLLMAGELKKLAAAGGAPEAAFAAADVARVDARLAEFAGLEFAPREPAV